MRLYRFIDTDKKIDVVVVTDGSCEQKEFLSLNLQEVLFLLVLSILLLMKKQEAMLFLLWVGNGMWGKVFNMKSWLRLQKTTRLLLQSNRKD